MKTEIEVTLEFVDEVVVIKVKFNEGGIAKVDTFSVHENDFYPGPDFARLMTQLLKRMVD